MKRESDLDHDLLETKIPENAVDIFRQAQGEISSKYYDDFDAFKQQIDSIIRMQLMPHCLKRIFGENIRQIILFGSTARMEAVSESDIDIAIILRQELSCEKRDEFLEWSAEFDMKHEKVFSFIDIEKEKMEQWGDILPLYKNIQKEGIVLWKTA